MYRLSNFLLFFLWPSSTALWVSGRKGLYTHHFGGEKEGVLGWQIQIIVLSSSAWEVDIPCLLSPRVSCWHLMLASTTDELVIHFCLVNWPHLDLVGSVHALKSGSSSHLFPALAACPMDHAFRAPQPPLWRSFMLDPCIGTCPIPSTSCGALSHTWQPWTANSGAFSAWPCSSLGLLWRHPVRCSLSKALHKKQRKQSSAFGFSRPFWHISSI